MKTMKILVGIAIVTTAMGTYERSPLYEELNPDDLLNIEQNIIAQSPSIKRNLSYVEVRRNKDKKGRDNRLAKVLLDDAVGRGNSNLITLLQRANTYAQIGKTADAIRLYCTVLDHAEYSETAMRNAALLGLGYAYRLTNDFEKALIIYRHLMEYGTSDNNFLNLVKQAAVFSLLSNEQWSEAHELYRSLRTPEKNALYTLINERKGDLSGTTILIRQDAGLAGDTLVFGLLGATKLHQMGAKVIWQIESQLYPLVSRQAWPEEVSIVQEIPSPEHYTVAVETMDLMPLLNWETHTIPNSFPYLVPRSDLVSYWKEQVAHDSKKVKIGVCFAAGNIHDKELRPENAYRIFSLRDFLESIRPFLHEVSVYSLQLTDEREQIAALPADLKQHVHILSDYNTAGRDRFEDALALVTEVFDYMFSVGAGHFIITGLATEKAGKSAVIIPEVRNFMYGKLGRKNTLFFPHVEQIMKKNLHERVPQIVETLLAKK